MTETVPNHSPPAAAISPLPPDDRRCTRAAGFPPRRLSPPSGDMASGTRPTPFAHCAIRKCLSAPPITKASSPSISLITAVNRNDAMIDALNIPSPVTRPPRRSPQRNGYRDEYAPISMPATSREVDSGISTHRSTRLISIRARCPICEDLHEWQVADGSLGTALSADHHSNGARSTKAQSALQDFQGPSTEIIELREQLLDELNHRLKNNLQMRLWIPANRVPQNGQLGSS